MSFSDDSTAANRPAFSAYPRANRPGKGADKLPLVVGAGFKRASVAELVEQQDLRLSVTIKISHASFTFCLRDEATR